jgi:adenine phosphoribosyltransferase
MDLNSFIRDIPDFPKPGILFKDITPLLDNSKAFNHVIDQFANSFKEQSITKIAGIDSRGFIFGAALAHHLGISFVPIRKKGKLPAATYTARYELEYGFDEIQIHQDALTSSDHVLLIDDLLATGGTAKAACELIEFSGATLSGIAFVIELGFLNGREKLPETKIVSLITYD